MDTKELVAQARARFNHQQQRISLESKYRAELNLIYNGGLWELTAELLGYLSSIQQETIILVDTYNKPIRVNVAEMREIAFEKYNEIMQDWLDEYQETVKLR